MLSSAVSYNNEVHCEEQAEEESAKIIGPGICIPKIEPAYDSFNAKDDFLNDNEEEPLIPFVTPYKLKDPIVVLERCDKIWNTLKLIKNAQTVGYNNNNNNETIEPSALERDRSPQKQSSLSYVQYEPVLGNDNENLPNFKFFVKTKKKLYHCDVCGRQYTQLSSLKHHYCRVHEGNISQELNKESRPADHPKQTHQKQNNNTIVQSKEKRLGQSNKSEQNAARKAYSEQIIENVVRENGKQHPNTIVKTGCYKCMLCGTVVQRITKHMKYYHKIVVDDGSMINNLVTPLEPTVLETDLNKNSIASNKGDKKSAENLANALVEKSFSTTVREDKGSTSKKRKSTSDHFDQRRRRTHDNVTHPAQRLRTASLSVSSDKPQYTCNKCSLAFSTESQLCTHRCSLRQVTKRHSVSGEQHGRKPSDMTQESDVPSDTTTKTMNVEEQTPNNLNDTNDKPQNDNKQENLENICNCGRSFRTVTMLLIHKMNCKSRDETEENRTGRSSSDGDSGIGIHITIKKKNDSYEIVGRGSGDEASQKDPLELSDVNSDCTTEGRRTPTCNSVLVCDTSPYSKDHSILKLQVVDEDVVVDIEDELADDEDSKSNETDMTNVSLNSTNGTQYKGNKDTDVERLPEKRRTKHYCICGTTYRTESALKDHMLDVHPLLLRCGYCKKAFDNITEINDHICSITKGEPYVSSLNIPCFYCNMIFDRKLIEKHIRSEHGQKNSSRIPCYLCSETFLTSKQRSMHIEKEHTSFKCCSICYKKLPVRRKIRHESYHFGLGFPCHLCKLSFDTNMQFKTHSKCVH